LRIKETAMTSAEALVLIGIIAVFVAFGVTLALVSRKG